MKYVKRLKVYENFSITEKELFREAERILKREKKKEENNKKRQLELIDKEKFPKSYIPKNNIIERLESANYDKNIPDCLELETNDIRRIFNTYDKTNIGLIKKNEIQFVFLDIKNVLSKTITINEKKFLDLMLDFYAKSKETCSISEIKKCFGNILHNHHSESVKKSKLIPDLVYLKGIAFDSSLEEKKVNKSNSINFYKAKGREDVFQVKCYGKDYKVVLNENKLQSIYK